MIAYLDASVVLRIALGEAAQLAEWHQVTVAVSSSVLSVECHRSLDRLWQQGRLSEETLVSKTDDARAILARFDLRPLSKQILETASQPFPTPLGTLDALHLATAMAYRVTRTRDQVVFATHDLATARAARAMHFEVIGGAA